MNWVLLSAEGSMKAGGTAQVFLFKFLLFLCSFCGEDVASHSFIYHAERFCGFNLEWELARELIQLCYFHRHESGRTGTAYTCLSETIKLLLTNVHPLLSLK